MIIFNMHHIFSLAFILHLHPLCVQNSSAGTTSLPFEVQVLFSPNSRNVTSSGPRPLLDLRQYPEINVTGNNTVQVRLGEEACLVVASSFSFFGGIIGLVCTVYLSNAVYCVL